MKIIQFIVLLFLFSGTITAQEPENSELYKVFIKKDSLMFDVGFNQCNLEPLENLLTDDLEFYHDVGGIQNKEQFMEAMTKNICSSPERKPIRKLIPHSMKVYPLYENGRLYGAIVDGKHEFYIKETNKELYKTGSALFSGLWVVENDDWKIKRVYSYHHQPN